MTKRNENKEKVVADVSMPIDGADPKTCVSSLVKIAEVMMETLGRDRMQGALALAAASAFIIDSQCADWAKEQGADQDGARTMDVYMQNAMAAWNTFLFMFGDLDLSQVPKIPGMRLAGLEGMEDEDETRPKGETLQ